MVENSKKSRQQPTKPVYRHSQLLARPEQPTPKDHKTSSEHVDPGEGPTSLRSDLKKNLSAQTNGSATISHPANTVAGKTYKYVIVG